MPTVVIVGAGISGLAIAYRLQQQSPQTEIIVLEQGDRPGGTIWTRREQGFQVEVGPNGFLGSKPATLDLCGELGLSEQLLPADDAAARNRYLFVDGRLQLLPGSLLRLLRTRFLSWRGKLNFFAERFRSAGRDLGDESIAAFARRRAGREIAATFADALVTGIFAGDPELLSMSSCFPRIVQLEREYGSVLKGLARTRRARPASGRSPNTLWTLRPGLRLLVETLRDRLRKPPMLGVAVRRLARKGNNPKARWLVQGDGLDAWEADAIALACPAYEQARLLGDLDPVLADLVGQIPYNRLAVVALGFHRQDISLPLNGFGYIAPQSTRRDLLGVQWCSSIYPDRCPSGQVLLRAMCGGWQRPEIVDWDDTRLIQAVKAELREAMRITAEPTFVEIIRWDRAIPQYHVGHGARLARIEESCRQHPGLFLAGNSYRGVAINDCTEQAGLVAERVRTYLASPGDA